MTWKLLGLLLLLLVGLHCVTRDARSGRSPGPLAVEKRAPETSKPDPEGNPRPVRKLRILCLHGYHGNSEILRGQMRSLMAGLESRVELVYLDAPSLSEGDYGWWHAVSQESTRGGDDSGVGHAQMRYEGWERTRKAIVAAFEERGPFDGVFGFSQGAVLTGLLVGLRAPGGVPTPEQPLTFDFAILVSGFVSNDPAHAPLYARRASYALPSLHIVGRSDGVVPSRDSRPSINACIWPRRTSLLPW